MIGYLRNYRICELINHFLSKNISAKEGNETVKKYTEK
jgi:hypothetical protein